MIKQFVISAFLISTTGYSEEYKPGDYSGINWSVRKSKPRVIETNEYRMEVRTDLPKDGSDLTAQELEARLDIDEARVRKILEAREKDQPRIEEIGQKMIAQEERNKKLKELREQLRKDCFGRDHYRVFVLEQELGIGQQDPTCDPNDYYKKKASPTNTKYLFPDNSIIEHKNQLRQVYYHEVDQALNGTLTLSEACRGLQSLYPSLRKLNPNTKEYELLEAYLKSQIKAFNCPDNY